MELILLLVVLGVVGAVAVVMSRRSKERELQRREDYEPLMRRMAASALRVELVEPSSPLFRFVQ